MVGGLEHIAIPFHQQVAAVHDSHDGTRWEAGAEDRANAVSFLEAVKVSGIHARAAR